MWLASAVFLCPDTCLSGKVKGQPTAPQRTASPPAVFPAEPCLFSVTVLKNNPVKVEAEVEDAALDCSVNSRASEKHPLDSVFTALQDVGKRKPGGDGQPDSVPSVKRRRLIPEVRSQPSPQLASALTPNEMPSLCPGAARRLLGPWA